MKEYNLNIKIDNIKADILPFDFNKLNINPSLDLGIDRQEEKCSTGKTGNEKVTKTQYKASNR